MTTAEMKAVERLQAEANDMLGRVDAFQILDQESLKLACEERNTISDKIKAVKAHHAPIKKSAKATHTEACNAEKRAMEPWQKAQGLLEPKIIAFQEQQKRIKAQRDREAEEVARRQSEELQEMQVDQAVAAGASDAEIDAMIDAPPPAVAVVAPPPPIQRVVGSATVSTYKAEVYDLNALISAVATGRAARNYLQANQTTLNKWAAATEGRERIPGVTVVEGAYMKDTRR